MDRDAFAAWFRLLQVPGLGRDAARRLAAAFGSPQAALAADAQALAACVGPALAAAVAKPPPAWESRFAAACRWLDGAADRQVIGPDDRAYPPLLAQTADPPLLLYVQGDATRLSQPAVAVVGSRGASAQGLDLARHFGRGLADAGLVVVSGLAQGIDGAAHEGALDGAAGTVAIVGTGPDRVYPARHAALARRIAERGAVASEFAPGTPALPEHFPQRNRIIAGLSLATLVVEAALRSGSLITARLAAEAGRDVFALPGSLASPQSRGCHALIKDGAQLVESVAEIVAALQGRTAAPPAEAAPAARADPVLAALGHDPVTLDALLARTGWPLPELMARLLDLELEGQVARLPGGLFQRRLAA